MDGPLIPDLESLGSSFARSGRAARHPDLGEGLSELVELTRRCVLRLRFIKIDTEVHHNVAMELEHSFCNRLLPGLTKLPKHTSHVAIRRLRVLPHPQSEPGRASEEASAAGVLVRLHRRLVDSIKRDDGALGNLPLNFIVVGARHVMKRHVAGRQGDIGRPHEDVVNVPLSGGPIQVKGHEISGVCVVQSVPAEWSVLYDASDRDFKDGLVLTVPAVLYPTSISIVL